MFSLAGRYFYGPPIPRCELQLEIAHKLHRRAMDGSSGLGAAVYTSWRVL